MDAVGYRPVAPLIPPRKRPAAKTVLFVLAVSLLFWQSGNGVSAEAYDQPTTPPGQLNSTTNYLAVVEDAPKPFVFSNSYILLNPANSEVLISKNPSTPVPIASTTKMATALVVRQQYDVNDVVVVSAKAAGIIGSDIQLMTGEKITVHSLLKGLLIQSGNDAAFALAEHYSKTAGEYQPFVNKMNEYVKGVGLKNTTFGDPAGLDDQNGRSTAWDLAQLARLVLADPILSEIIKIPKTTISSVDGQYSHELISSNRLILTDSPYYLPGAVGVKTGFTPDAGHCLVSAYNSAHGPLIAVVLNTAEYTITASASESRKLFLWADRYIEERAY